MKSEEKILKPIVVHEIAAQLFWRLAEKVGVAEAFFQTEDSNGWCLFIESFSGGVLSKYYEANQLDTKDRRELISAVAKEAAQYASGQKNLGGIVYRDDVYYGRSPGAIRIESNHLNKPPKAVTALSGFGNQLLKRGTLCIRHPLPSVVFVEDLDCLHNIFEVEKTELALGFSLTIFMQPTGYRPMPCSTEDEPNPGARYVIDGVFHIPVPDIESGDQWNSLILNSSRFVNESHFHAVKSKEGEDCGAHIRAFW